MVNPIQIEKEILYCVENFSCVVIIAETGSGKTTCNKSNKKYYETKTKNLEIPQYLAESGYALNNKKIGVT